MQTSTLVPQRLALWLAAAVLAGCATLQPPEKSTATLRSTAPITAGSSNAAAAWPTARWWEEYADPTLSSLIAQALSQAPGIASADARIRSAEQNARIASAALGLSINASAQFEERRLSDNGLLPTSLLGFNWYGQSDLGVTVRYQFDWWGKQHAAMEAALDRTRAAAAERQAAALALAAAVGESYFGWQADTARIALLQHSQALLEHALRLAQQRADADLDSIDTVLSVRHALAARHEQLAVLSGQRQLRVITLAALLGVGTDALPPLTARELPRTTGALPDDIGTNLLARRPDVAASRWRVEAALRDTDSARASFYPDISLHALAGLSSIELGRLLRADSGVPAAGFAIDLPLFDANLRQARHGAAQASLGAAIAAYDEAVVTAAREAGGAATTLMQTRAQRAQRELQLDVAQEQVRIASARVREGLTHQGPQLEATLAEITEQDALIALDLNALLADIQLKQSLGGGSLAQTEEAR